jgi:hypothetical protein
LLVDHTGPGLRDNDLQCGEWVRAAIVIMTAGADGNKGSQRQE